MKLRFNLIHYGFGSLKYILHISNLEIMMGSHGTKISSQTYPIPNIYNKISWEK
jgi:hypothetical protein